MIAPRRAMDGGTGLELAFLGVRSARDWLA